MKDSFVFVARNIPDIGIEMLIEKGYEVKIGAKSRNLTNKELRKQAKGADALLSLLTNEIDGDTMDAIGPQLKIIANYATGFDNIDVKAASKRGIVVTNTPGVLVEAVAEHTVALVLAVTKRIPEADRFTRAGKYTGWEPKLFLGTELNGKIFGLVGHGRIGCSVAEKMKQAFNMTVVYYDAYRGKDREERCGIGYAHFSDLLEEADIVSLHVPLLPSTEHLIGEKQLRIMKESAYLINTSRGPVIDEQALLKALREKWIRGAAIDVFEHEPKLTPGLAQLENIVLTPHIASATRHTRDAMATMAAENIIAALSEERPPNVVD